MRHNKTGNDEVYRMCGHQFVIPRGAKFLLADITGLGALLKAKPNPGFRLIVLDPPWPSMSVSRSHKYKTLNPRDLINLPIRKLLYYDDDYMEEEEEEEDVTKGKKKERKTAEFSPSWVMIWVTNDPDLHRLVRHKMLKKWRCE
eukprot:jgi/Bigna1/81922/fgenesh1_pg.85_\